MILSWFSSSPQYLRGNEPGYRAHPDHVPGLLTRLRYMGVRHVELCAVHELHHLPWLKANNLRCITIGDNFMRTPELAVVNCTRDKVKASAYYLAQSGICDGIEMVDETRADPAQYPLAKDFIEWWRFAGGPPISWPTLNPRFWTLPEYSDYDSAQFKWEAYDTYAGMERALAGSLSRKPTDRELCALIPASFFYIKRSPGNQYNPRKDKLDSFRPTGKQVGKFLDLAYDMGARRFRIYGIDPPERGRARMAAPIGARVQQGTGLFDSRWPGIEMAVRGFVQGNR